MGQKTDSREFFRKEVMERDVLNRIKWDPKLNPGEYGIHYLDRISGRLLKAGFSEIKLEGDFFRLGDSLIPMHRIRKITWKKKVVWEKRRI